MSTFESILDNLKNVGNDISVIKDNMGNLFENPRIRILTIIIFVIFFGVSLYIYFKYIHPNINLDYVPNREFSKGDDADKIVILWFYTEWCPYCKSTYNEWTSFKNDVEKRDYEMTIEFREIDCDKNEKFASQYNIEEYPTVRIVYKDQIYIYDAKPDRVDLMEFFKGSLPEIANTPDRDTI